MVHITYFVHGTTTDNERGLATGWLPGKLSAKGLDDAAQLGRVVADMQFDAIIVSDLKRAIETAAIAFKGHDFTTDDRLREANYGRYNGQPSADFKAALESYIDTPFPDGESYLDVEARLRSLCDELRQKYDSKHVALVAHQGPQLALDVICKGKTWPQAIAEDWRKTHAYQDGWKYTLCQEDSARPVLQPR